MHVFTKEIPTGDSEMVMTTVGIEVIVVTEELGVVIVAIEKIGQIILGSVLVKVLLTHQVLRDRD